jgi:uncharacterized protein YhaN
MRRTIDTPAVRAAKDDLAAARKELEQQEKALRHLDAEAAELADAVTEAKAKAWLAAMLRSHQRPSWRRRKPP